MPRRVRPSQRVSTRASSVQRVNIFTFSASSDSSWSSSSLYLILSLSLSSAFAAAAAAARSFLLFRPGLGRGGRTHWEGGRLRADQHMAHCLSNIPPTVLLALSEVVEVRALAMLGVRLIPEAASQGPNSGDCERAIQDE